MYKYFKACYMNTVRYGIYITVDRRSVQYRYGIWSLYVSDADDNESTAYYS